MGLVQRFEWEQKMATRAIVSEDRTVAEVRMTSRGAQKQATRQAVLNAAIKLFAARGFDGTTMPAITAECGVPVPLMVYHFKSKEQLWRDCVNEVYRRLDAHNDRYQKDIDEAQGYEFFRVKIRAQIRALAAEPEYMRILFQEGTQKSERLEWLVENHQRRMTGAICLKWI
jgi:TetR/AcrR family transcriptional regulator